MKVLASLSLVALLVVSPSAQMAQPSGDPISGTWTGFMAPSDGNQHPVTVTLKMDGKNFTGTVVGPRHPGDIKGTFDPATGAVKFDVTVRDDARTVVPFDGKLAGDALTGELTFNGQKGTFKLTRGAQSAASAAGAPPSDDAASMGVRRGFATVSGYITKAAEMVPADKYSYKPTDSVRTFGQLVGHMIDGYNYFCTTATGRKVEWSEATEKGPTDKATLVAKLKTATDACTAAHTSSREFGLLIDNIGHTNLHYGNVITYMRMMGLTPPSS